MFLNPIMLAGLAGAMVPVVLHLMSRARYRSVGWGAMMFLDGAMPQHRQTTRMKQSVLLLLRMAMVAALAMAMARPVLRAGAGLFEGPVTAVIVLDASGSMGFEEGGRSRLDAGREAALAVLSGLSRGDRAALVVAGDPPSAAHSGALAPHSGASVSHARALEVRPTTDLQSLAGRIVDLEASASSADIAESLGHAADVLQRHGQGRLELYLITDRQAVSWSGLDDGFAEGWDERWRQGSGFRDQEEDGRGVRFVTYVVGGERAENVSVESVELVNSPGIVNQPLDIDVTVRNHGTMDRAGMPLMVRSGRRELYQTPVNVAAGEAVSVRASVTFADPGTKRVTAEIEAAGLQMDNHLDVLIEVVEPIPVLIVSGDERPERFGSESGFLRLALAPFGHRDGSLPGKGDAAVVEVVGYETGRPSPSPSPSTGAGQAVEGREDGPGPSGEGAQPSSFPEYRERLEEMDLSRYQVVVLANVPSLTPMQVRALEQFVHGGGGLWMAPGNLSRVENYNMLLYREGAGTLPAMLQGATSADGAQATSLLGLELGHPMFRFLSGRPDPVPSATIGRYFPVGRRQADAQVLATYVTGDPFLVELGFGRGRVLLMTTPVDADWGTLPLSNFYLPFVQSAVRYLAGGTLSQRNLHPGERLREIVKAIDPVEASDPRASEAVVTLPDGSRETVPVVRNGDRGEVTFERTQLPGLYSVRVRVDGGWRTSQFMVRRPAEESDLSALGPERWMWLESRLGAQVMDGPVERLAQAMERPAGGRELWPVLLGVVLVLGVVEMVAARVWLREG
jgi:hypothetical protein